MDLGRWGSPSKSRVDADTHQEAFYPLFSGPQPLPLVGSLSAAQQKNQVHSVQAAGRDGPSLGRGLPPSR